MDRLIVETDAISVETNDSGSTIIAKQSGHTFTLNETESAHLWRAIILQWAGRTQHIFE